MKTIEEKIKIIEEHDKARNNIISLLEAALNGNRLQQAVAIDAMMNIEIPLMQMYVDEINEALNPLANSVVAAAIVALETTLHVLKTQHPSQNEIAQIMMESVGAKTSVFSVKQKMEVEK